MLSGHGSTGCNFNTEEVEAKVIFDYMLSLKLSLYTRPYKRKEKERSRAGVGLGLPNCTGAGLSQ